MVREQADTAQTELKAHEAKLAAARVARNEASRAVLKAGLSKMFS
jgi:hypothetical protein